MCVHVCSCLPFTFFLFKATRGRLEGNWAFPCFIACWPLAEVWYGRVKEWRGWRLATYSGFAIPMGFTAVLTIHLIYPIPLMSPSSDRAYRQWGRMETARAVAEDLRKAGHTGPVYAQTYQWVALLRWHGVDARQIDGASRPSQFTNPPESPVGMARAVVCAEGFLPKQLATGFAYPNLVTRYPVMVRGELFQELMWIEYSTPLAQRHKKPAGHRLDPAPVAPPR